MLLLGLDGARWDIIVEDGVGEFLTETAQQAVFRTMVMEPPTLSGPGSPPILTGSTTEEHGVRDNSLVGKQVVELPGFSVQGFLSGPINKYFCHSKLVCISGSPWFRPNYSSSDGAAIRWAS
ncbi:alkaline phosphatase family protein [Corynebacterium glutamicum]|uniref:alkaline phosphatase family protein n=1 Tax=Corynebacterium glutamicum TaxID=1718 RepID=UPI00058A568E|nr:alkaline phosphatase family protein [Corynebacterium glutamicum]AJE68100.1 hypothetical protein SB89_11395 [Corynebacterium glutamicum]OKX90954.1 hypothetical protein AUP72_08795 [Corynebacterium glutamicum]TWS37245.1 hypothetical protein AKJ21_06325 [Corynebacterium glutamicum]